MHKTAFYAKTFYTGTSCGPGRGSQCFDNIIQRIQLFVYNIHNGDWSDIPCFKKRFAMAVNDRIVGIDLGKDKLFHNKRDILWFFFEKLSQLRCIFNTPGQRRTDTIVRFDNDRIADFPDKLPAAGESIDHMISCGRDTGFLVIGFHMGFVTDPRQIVCMETRGNVEVCTQLCILLQPVFIVGFNPVDPAVFENIKSYGTVDAVVLFKIVHFIIFCKRIL